VPFGPGDEAAEGVKVAESMEAGQQQAGVDGPGYGVGDGHGCDHRCAGHLSHVPGGEAPALLRQQDDAGRRRCRVLQEGSEGEVAGAPHHGEAVVGDDTPVPGRARASVDHGGGARHWLRGEPQARGRLQWLLGVMPWQAEQDGCGANVGDDQRGGPVSGGEDGENGGNGRGALPALGTDQRDGPTHG
jgi:hypothetical protein